MGTGADVAIESAGFTLVKGNLDGIVCARKLAQATRHNICQNLFFALIYNASVLPVAAGVLFPFFGILISRDVCSFCDECLVDLGGAQCSPVAEGSDWNGVDRDMV
jgi:Cu+-exporting ATPase